MYALCHGGVCHHMFLTQTRKLVFCPSGNLQCLRPAWIKDRPIVYFNIFIYCWHGGNLFSIYRYEKWFQWQPYSTVTNLTVDPYCILVPLILPLRTMCFVNSLSAVEIHNLILFVWGCWPLLGSCLIWILCKIGMGLYYAGSLHLGASPWSLDYPRTQVQADQS